MTDPRHKLTGLDDLQLSTGTNERVGDLSPATLVQLVGGSVTGHEEDA